MDIQGLILRYLPLVKKNWLLLSLGILGMIFFASGLIGLFSSSETGSEGIVFEANSADNRQSEAKTILVDIEGCVAKPGVYKLPQSSIIQDGLVAAGGLSIQADRKYVAKNFNLATKLTDGAKIYVPSVGEAVSGTAVLNASSEGIVTGSLININISSQSQLEALPGVGPVTAQKIIAGRPYGSVDELLSKKMVGSKVFDQIKDKVSAY
jgi:competence protein ComEA